MLLVLRSTPPPNYPGILRNAPYTVVEITSEQNPLSVAAVPLKPLGQWSAENFESIDDVPLLDKIEL